MSYMYINQFLSKSIYTSVEHQPGTIFREKKVSMYDI